jgi:hypothetical protein
LLDNALGVENFGIFGNVRLTESSSAESLNDFITPIQYLTDHDSPAVAFNHTFDYCLGIEFSGSVRQTATYLKDLKRFAGGCTESLEGCTELLVLEILEPGVQTTTCSQLVCCSPDALAITCKTLPDGVMPRINWFWGGSLSSRSSRGWVELLT